MHENGRIIDSIGDDDGSFSPERAGATQLLEILKMCYSGEYSYSEIKRKCCGQGGLCLLKGEEKAKIYTLPSGKLL